MNSSIPVCARPGCGKPASPNSGRKGGHNLYCSLDCGRISRSEILKTDVIKGSVCACGGPKDRGAKKCGKCELIRRAAQTNSASEPLDIKLLATLKHGEQTPDSLAQRTGATPGQVLDALIALKAAGRNLYQFGDRWSLEREPKSGGIEVEPLISDADGWHRIGAIGDTHLCSKQERLEELHDMYRIFEANAITRVLHTGNYIDGEARFNKHELKVHGMDAQLAYMGEHYPQMKGITTDLISGDDHEGWYGQREGVDIGFYMQKVMRRGGREDLRNLGYMECFLPMTHAKTGATSMIHVIHPGGGSAYATSYTVQKIVEGYEGGEKPAVLLAGHYHKMEDLTIRNVFAYQTGCFQDQTIFARKKKLTFTIGGWLLMFRQNPETGAIEEAVSYKKQYFNRGYYVNQRWSLSGPVAQVPRIAA